MCARDPEDGEPFRLRDAQELRDVALDVGARRQVLEDDARVDEVERARVSNWPRSGAALTRNSHGGNALVEARACATIASEMSTPTAARTACRARA